MQKNLLKLLDLSKEEIMRILDVADQLKYEQKNNMSHKILEGKTLAMIFEKASTRTRVSFEVGIFQLGGHGVVMSSADSQLGRGEPIKDTARVLSRYCDGIMMRTFGQETIEEVAKYSSVPVINGLTDFSHPCQVLADLMTIRERLSRLEGVKICYIGDGNNMANSIIVGGLKCGMNVSVACPKGYEPHKTILEFAENADAEFVLTTDIYKAAKNADVVITDVWASMGMEKDAEKRRKAFKGYCVDDKLMSYTNNAMVQHCLPAHRGEEISDDVLEGHADEIFEEAENRLHVQKAVMAILMGNI
ncbi:MAG: ornithine carbamoyltransferase [Erysipelotrichaceae bacterium]|nr:ornithine carbamoyltransferase [Erysipelotrichaceae bacterium]